MASGEGPQLVYVGVPGFVADGDPLEDAISDAIVECLEVDPTDVEVIESQDKFYVFIKSLPFTFATANETVSRAAALSQTYDQGVARLTKLVRRADKVQTDLHALKKDVAALARERDELQEQLEQAQTERQQQIDLARAVESDLQTLINTLSSK
jgi:uncharacterized coiled-coil DUF342 family protein